MWPAWGLIGGSHRGGWPVATYQPIAAHLYLWELIGGPLSPKDANSVGSSWDSPALAWGQVLLSKGVCFCVKWDDDVTLQGGQDRLGDHSSWSSQTHSRLWSPLVGPNPALPLCSW